MHLSKMGLLSIPLLYPFFLIVILELYTTQLYNNPRDELLVNILSTVEILFFKISSPKMSKT